MLKHAVNVSEMLSAFPSAPLASEDFGKFYVNVDAERDHDLSRLEELKKTIMKQSCKVLFAGHRGSGKSTELNRLTGDLESKFFAVKFSVTEQLDVYDLNYIDLIMVMMEQVADQAAEHGLLDQDNKFFKLIESWLTQVTTIKSEDTGYMLEVGAGLKANRGVLSSLIGLFAEFKTAIKAGSSTKKEYRTNLENRVSLLKAHCNLLASAVDQALESQGKRLLIIVEDMDKVETGRSHEIFFQHSGILSELQVRVVFAVSIFTLTRPELADIAGCFEIVSLPMLKVCARSGGPFDPGIEVIKQIVERRAELSLFAKDVLEIMIDRCGGVLRDLFEMIEIAATSAEFKKLPIIDQERADYAFNRLKRKYLGMITVEGREDKEITTKDLYRRLIEVDNSKPKQFGLDKINILLLSCLAVVEYNGEHWMDVHPAVKSILETIDKDWINAK
ncbi:MAG: AAA family ATPase [Deltaproteobacteria bacterium]|nr:AAA family ATPase [Deltaproteobacteria bacterium]